MQSVTEATKVFVKAQRKLEKLESKREVYLATAGERFDKRLEKARSAVSEAENGIRSALPVQQAK